jgi:hypothetical protein
VPTRGAVALAYGAVVLGGLLGAAVGWGLVDAGYADSSGLARAIGACVGALVATGGAGVVAVLMLRAMTEWNAHPPKPEHAVRPRTDWKVPAISALAVLVTLALVVGAVMTVTSGRGSDTCGAVRNDAAKLRERIAAVGPLFVNTGGSCSFWVALVGGDLVAYDTTIPGRDCVVDYDREAGTFRCGGAAVGLARLRPLRSEVRTEDAVEQFVVDLTPTTTTAAVTTG